MTKGRLALLFPIAGCVLLAAGCRTLAGSACLKQPLEAEIGNNAPLRIPLGLDAVDTTEALKVPPLDESKVASIKVDHCLEDPPLIQPLPDPVAEEKKAKRAARKASREARDNRVPGPRRIQGN